MKASELRIGNLVFEKGDIFEITSISRGGDLRLFSSKENHSSGISKVEPIPLTEEWLVRLGFTVGTPYSNDRGFFSPCKYYFFEGDIEFLLFVSGGRPINNIELEHVHQLQNLYFALTGEELTYD
jgi:hypothetical protein